MNKKLDGSPHRDYLRHPSVLPTAAHLFVVNTRDLSAGREHEISEEGMLVKGKGKPPAGHRSLRGSCHLNWLPLLAPRGCWWRRTPATPVCPVQNAGSQEHSDCTDNKAAISQSLTLSTFGIQYALLLYLIFIILNIYMLLNSIILAG